MILSIVKAFFAVFGVMDPLGNTPVFLSLTERLDEKTKRSLATKAVIRAGIVLLVFVFLGNIILDFFHISLQSFRIAGGIILLLIGLQLLFGLRFSNEPEIMADDLSVVPLATPLIAGPGMITAVVIFSKEYGYLITIIGIVAAIAVPRVSSA
ncbi:MAG: MarC family protein, partial [Patescibacteria group bacterium]